jgi:2-polyprenyl-3-methyl-5-hydroxy-6-metoxy-1,4-benzoquinol methylase
MNYKHVENEIIEKGLGISPDYQYKAIRSRNFIQSNWHSNKFTSLEYCLKIKNKKIKVLDLGVGSGNFEIIFAKGVKHITALDHHKEALDFLKSVLKKDKIENVNLVHGDIRNLKKTKGLRKNYDLILLVDVIEHIELDEADKMIKYLKKILIPGGIICVITPNYKSLWIHIEAILDRFTIVPHFKGHQHLAKYYPKNLSEIFKKNNLTNVYIKSFNLFSFIIPMRRLSVLICRLELNSNIKFGNLLLGVFKNEKK